MIFELFVPGVPAPQGSKTQGIGRGGKPYMREDNPKTKPWRTTVVRALQDERGRLRAQFDGAVWVGLRFVFPRPKSHAPDSLMTNKPDVDKLCRAVLDALTQAKVITDDAYVVKLREAEKIYGPNPGVHIRIGSVTPNPFGRLQPDMPPIEIAQYWQPRTEDAAHARLAELEDVSWQMKLRGGEDDL